MNIHFRKNKKKILYSLMFRLLYGTSFFALSMINPSSGSNPQINVHADREGIAIGQVAPGGQVIVYQDVRARPLTPEECGNLFQRALLYELGDKDVTQNLPEAIRQYRILSEQEHAGACYHLGMLYFEGRTGNRSESDFSEGLRLLKLSVDKGNAKAMYKLGTIMEEGSYGEPRDCQRALSFQLRSAYFGYELAQAKIRDLWTSSAIHDPFKLSDVLSSLSMQIPREGLHIVAPTWQGANWFNQTFPLLIHHLNDPLHFDPILAYSGCSVMDISCLYQHVGMFNALIEKGAGRTLTPRVLLSFYQTVREAAQHYPDNTDLQQALRSFKILEERNRPFKLQMAIEHLCGGRFQCVPPSTYPIRGVTDSGEVEGNPTFLPLEVLVYNEKKEEYTNKIKRCNQDGRSTVARASGGGYTLYFKFFPEIPGIETAVSTLTEDLIGFGTAPSVLFKSLEPLTVPVLKPALKKTVWLTRVMGEEHLIDSVETHIPILVSLGVEGRTLKEVFEQPIDPDTGVNVFDNLDQDSLYKLMIVAMLTNPEDGKSDNYVVERITSEERPTFRIIGIDNDHAFVPALAEVGTQRVKINTKTILYAFDEIERPIPFSVCEHFKAKLTDMDSILRSWLCRLREANHGYEMLFPDSTSQSSSSSSSNTFSHNQRLFEAYHSFIGIPFAPYAMSRLYTKCIALKRMMEQEESVRAHLTPLDLFFELEPLLKKRYGEMLRYFKHKNLKERFIEIEGEAAHKTLSKPLDILVSYAIPNDPRSRQMILEGKAFSPGQATEELEEIIHQTEAFECMAAGEVEAFRTLKKNWEEVLQNIPFGSLSDLVNDKYLDALQDIVDRNVKLGNITLTNHKTVRTVHLKNWPEHTRHEVKQLSLAGCQRITQECVTFLTDKMVHLTSLDVSLNPNFTALSAQEEGRMFSSIPLRFHAPLRYLNVSQCASLRQIDIDAPLLEILDVSQCPRLTFIKGEFPRLKRLTINHTPAWSDQKMTDFIFANTDFLKTGTLVSEEGRTTVLSDAMRFVRGKLIFKPYPSSDQEMKEFLIRDFANPFDGEFDLDGLRYNNDEIKEKLRIKIGYRSVKENEDKVTVWLVPKFVIDQAPGNCAFKKDYERQPISWSSPIGIFWSYGTDELRNFDWLTTHSFDESLSKNLYDMWDDVAACGLQSVAVRPHLGEWCASVFRLFLINF